MAGPDGHAHGPDRASPEFDRYLDWLKYQALAERIWARRGFYQASGAFGFRDQLQDSVNLIWMDPSLARRQILLHASQQFLEGDVVHWFHLPPGRPDRVRRPDARLGQPPLAAPGPWSSTSAATGDDSLLDERTPYLESEQPFEPLPAGKHGMGFDPLRSSREDTVYRHCLKAIDLVLDKRMGAHGLPADGHRRLERRARRDRQPGQGRERLARLLPLLHPRPDGRRSWAEGGRRAAGVLPRPAARP